MPLKNHSRTSIRLSRLHGEPEQDRSPLQKKDIKMGATCEPRRQPPCTSNLVGRHQRQHGCHLLNNLATLSSLIQLSLAARRACFNVVYGGSVDSVVEKGLLKYVNERYIHDILMII